MNEGIQIAPAFQSWFPKTDFDALTDRFPIDLKKHCKRTQVSETTLTNAAGESLTVFYKVYASRAKPLHGFARRSRALREAANLDFIRSIGIPVPDVVARGYRRRLGGLCADLSFIITRAIPEATALSSWWQSDHSLDHRLRIIETLAEQTRALHEARFYHEDLKWRNLLVDGEQTLWWIDCPAGHQGAFPWRHHRGRIKDLASIDHGAVDKWTPSEREHFFKTYLQTDDTSTLKRWERAAAEYRQRRFGD